MSAAYTHQFASYGGAVVKANEQNTAARVEWPPQMGLEPREFVSEPARGKQPQGEPTATMQAMQAAKDVLKAQAAAAEAERLAKRETILQAARDKAAKREQGSK